MKSILLKIDDELFSELEKSVKENKTTKTGFIKKSLEDAIKAWKRKKLENKIRAEVEEIKKFDLDREIIKDFEEASLVDLQKHLNDDNDYQKI